MRACRARTAPAALPFPLTDSKFIIPAALICLIVIPSANTGETDGLA